MDPEENRVGVGWGKFGQAISYFFGLSSTELHLPIFYFLGHIDWSCNREIHLIREKVVRFISILSPYYNANLLFVLKNKYRIEWGVKFCLIL